MQNFLINDIFWTFQGEGANAGRRSLFIRLPKCNLRCSWCDTEFDSFKKMSLEELNDFIDKEQARFAVITGGEPLMNRQTKEIVAILKSAGFIVACETNGTWPYVEGIDFVTCSPKKDAGYEVHQDLFDYVNEFKYVVDTDFDFSILDRHDTSDGKRYSLSPEFNDMLGSVAKIETYIAKNPAWRLNLQTHKWIGIK